MNPEADGENQNLEQIAAGIFPDVDLVALLNKICSNLETVKLRLEQITTTKSDNIKTDGGITN